MHLDEDENMTLFVEVSMSWAIFICFIFICSMFLSFLRLQCSEGVSPVHWVALVVGHSGDKPVGNA